MKLICVDTDRCGFYAKVDELDDENHNNRCPHCYGLAIEISDKHYPLLYELEDDVESMKALILLASYHNLINELEDDDKGS